MAKTLLNGVNEVLQKLSVLNGNTGLLTTLADSGRQVWIDQTIQSWNEVMEAVYAVVQRPLPQILAENTITLVADDRDYALQTDLVEMIFPLLDETNGRYILEWEGGYVSLVQSQPTPASWTGLPLYGAIRDTDGELYLDRIPTAADAGLIYKYRYIKDASLSVAADQFPFSDAVFRAMVPAVAENVQRAQKKTFDERLFNSSLGYAGRMLNNVKESNSWSPRG